METGNIRLQFQTVNSISVAGYNSTVHIFCYIFKYFDTDFPGGLLQPLLLHLYWSVNQLTSLVESEDNMYGSSNKDNDVLKASQNHNVSLFRDSEH